MMRSYVYFISNGRGSVKIGLSGNPAKRLLTLQTSSEDKLSLLGSIKGGREHEAALHKRFGGDRLSGEWFTLTPNLQNEIDRLLTQGVADLNFRQGKKARGLRSFSEQYLDEAGSRIGLYLRQRFPSKTAAGVAAATGLKAATVQKALEMGGRFGTMSIIAMTVAFGPSFLAACYPAGLRPKWLVELEKQERRQAIQDQISALEQLRDAT